MLSFPFQVYEWLVATVTFNSGKKRAILDTIDKYWMCWKSTYTMAVLICFL